MPMGINAEFLGELQMDPTAIERVRMVKNTSSTRSFVQARCDNIAALPFHTLCNLHLRVVLFFIIYSLWSN